MESLNAHETSDRRDTKQQAKRTAAAIAKKSYCETTGGMRKVTNAVDKLCATILARIVHETNNQ